MAVEQAIRLDRDLGRIREANAEIARIQQAIRIYVDEAQSVLAAAKIDQEAFARGDVIVDFSTGNITRKTKDARK